MTVLLTLGPVLFYGLEVPEKISHIGGDHSLVTHKLVGGTRVVDAMGRDDADITWSGRFRAGSAETRAKLVDFLRIQGQPITLTWSIFNYQVIIKSFIAEYNNPNEIPYTITCAVVQDQTSPILTALLGLDSVLGSDLNGLLQIGTALNIPGVNKAIASVQSAMGAVQTFEGASSVVISGVQSAISLASVTVGSSITSNNAVVTASGSVGGVVAGGAPASLASSLLSQAKSFSALGSLYQAKNVLGRMFTNVGNSGN